MIKFSSKFTARCNAVNAYKTDNSALNAQLRAALDFDPVSLTDTLDSIHKIQRIYVAGELGLLDHPAVIDALLDGAQFPTWTNFTELNVSQNRKDTLARLLYVGHAPLAPLVLVLGDYMRGIGETVVQHCIDNGDEVDIWIDDKQFARRLMQFVNEEQAVKYGVMMAERNQGFARRVIAASAHPDKPYVDPQPNETLDNLRQTKFMERLQEIGWINQKFTGTFTPSRADAVQDGLDFDAYIELFFAMCEIDMDKITVSHNALVGMLNAGSTVHITNDDGTDIKFGITGMTFKSSLVDYNIPGTEVFSAPVREQVNGTIVAKGKFYPPSSNDKLIRDITLQFKDGRIIRANAVEGLQYLQEMIDKDEGSHYLGELAFGTNPALTRHVTNGLLVEKIGGSFHVAIGRAYEDQGEDAHIDNGNRSMVHWDITTMLRERGGMIAVDGIVIMRDGVYLDPRLAYLNG